MSNEELKKLLLVAKEHDPFYFTLDCFNEYLKQNDIIGFEFSKALYQLIDKELILILDKPANTSIIENNAFRPDIRFRIGDKGFKLLEIQQPTVYIPSRRRR